MGGTGKATDAMAESVLVVYLGEITGSAGTLIGEAVGASKHLT